MESDETYTKNMIQSYLKKRHIVVRIEPGNNPPDFNVYINGDTYALELTNAETLNSKNEKRREFSDPLFKLAQKVNKCSEVLKIFPNNKTLLLFINGKIKDYASFKKAILNYKLTDFDTYVKTINSFPEVTRYKVLNHDYVDKMIIKFIVGDKQDDSDIQNQINRIVQNIFIEKKKKMDKKCVPPKRWLGIKINHFFDGEKFWKNAVMSLSKNYNFSRVFFVSQSEDIYDYEL